MIELYERLVLYKSVKLHSHLRHSISILQSILFLILVSTRSLRFCCSSIFQVPSASFDCGRFNQLSRGTELQIISIQQSFSVRVWGTKRD